ncbi:MAG: hypothetical protein J5552_11590 [Prevotella sp.]|nr:hypothetical protein [Prevotella sp.]
MKAIYQKPTMEVEQMISDEVMVGASADGENIPGGGNTSDNNITEGDSRYHSSIWDED